MNSVATGSFLEMDLAIELMQSNLYRFNEISELLGYANYPYFSKVFKKLHAKTPHDYMKEVRPIEILIPKKTKTGVVSAAPDF
jgi:AraC-like DNA-binding protein